MKHTLTSIVLSSLLSAIVTAALFGAIVARTAGAQASAQTVTAQRVSIVDDQGRERISLGQSPDDDNSYELRVFGASGQLLLLLGGLDGVSSLSMSGGDVPWNVVLLGSKTGGTGLLLGDAGGNQTSVSPARLSVHRDNGVDWRAP